MKHAYYNEHDKFSAAWLRELIRAGHIADGEVDERDIQKVQASDLKGFAQVHLFAGIGGWSYALRLTEWPNGKPVWTGSCPCQDFSSAGKGEGHGGKRNLWPEMFRLIRECRPPVCFGEQVDAAIRYGWLDGIFVDLEAQDYACGAAVLPAAGVGAPHPRHRIYWLAHVNESCVHGRTSGGEQSVCDKSSESMQGLANATRRSGYGRGRKRPRQDSKAYRQGAHNAPERSGDLSIKGLGDTPAAGLQGEWCEYRPSGERHSGLVGLAMQTGVPQWNGPTIAIECSDGPRRVFAQPDSFPLAHGLSRRMGRLRGYGNAIVPQVAAEFIQSYLEITR